MECYLKNFTFGVVTQLNVKSWTRWREYTYLYQMKMLGDYFLRTNSRDRHFRYPVRICSYTVLYHKNLLFLFLFFWILKNLSFWIEWPHIADQYALKEVIELLTVGVVFFLFVCWLVGISHHGNICEFFEQMIKKKSGLHWTWRKFSFGWSFLPCAGRGGWCYNFMVLNECNKSHKRLNAIQTTYVLVIKSSPCLYSACPVNLRDCYRVWY
jgi:hypothetical protein